MLDLQQPVWARLIYVCYWGYKSLMSNFANQGILFQLHQRDPEGAPAGPLPGIDRIWQEMTRK